MKRLIRVYVSIPMAAKTLKDVRKERDRLFPYVVAELADSDVMLITGVVPHKATTPLGKLAQNLTRLGTANYVAFAKGWQDSRECMIERICAERYNIPVLFEE